MKKERVSFIATKYRNQDTQVHFYTKDGKRVEFPAIKKAPQKERVEFFIEKKTSERG